MSKGLRVILQFFQVLFVLAAVGLLAITVLMDSSLSYDGPGASERFVDTWLIGSALLAVAFSPALWSLARAGGPTGAPQSTGSFDRVAPAVPAQPSQPSQPGNVFEPMNASQAPAPPASSYGQGPSAGGITPTSSPQAGSPWGSGR